MIKKKDNRGGAGRNQGRKKGPETKPFSIRTRVDWIPIVKQVAKQAAKEKEAELKEKESLIKTNSNVDNEFQKAFSKEFMTFTPTDDELDNLAKIEGVVIDEEGSFTKEYNKFLYLYVNGELTAKVHKIAQPTPNFPKGGAINKKVSQN